MGYPAPVAIHKFDPATWNLDYLGGKGFHLVRMAKNGLRVPPGLILPTPLCVAYMQEPHKVMQYVVDEAVPQIMKELTAEFGYMPLVSVRSGAKVSMPGMMDTILNVGLCSENLSFWQDKLGKECYEESFARLQSMYESVVRKMLSNDAALQLTWAIEAVFKSWNNARAVTYRKLHKIPDDLGTAVIVQAMVFGNLNDQSATGVLFTRNPATGEDTVTGEFLVNAQGEDIVAGTRTPLPLTELEYWNKAISAELMSVVLELENRYNDMLDIEFTVQDGVLYILQCRVGKRTALAAVRIATDLYRSGRIDGATLLHRVTADQYFKATQPTVDPKFDVPPTMTGLPASVGVATGRVVFSAQAAVESAKLGISVILLSEETTPDDIRGMVAAQGVLTSRGGMTSHAAVVARGMNRVCVVGCSALQRVNDQWTYEAGNVTHVLAAGTEITLDGVTGRVWVDQKVPVIDGSQFECVKTFRKALREESPYLHVTQDLKEVTPTGTWFVPDLASYTPGTVKKALLVMQEGVIDLRPQVSPEDSLYDMFGGRDDLQTATLSVLDELKSAKQKSGVVVVVAELGQMLQGIMTTVSPAGDPVQQALNDKVMFLNSPLLGSTAGRIAELRAKAGEPIMMIAMSMGEKYPDSITVGMAEHVAMNTLLE